MICFLTPDYFSSLRDQAQLADIDLNHCSFGDDTQGSVEGRGGVLLHAEDGEAEGGLQLWVCDVSLFEPQALQGRTVNKNKVNDSGRPLCISAYKTLL